MIKTVSSSMALVIILAMLTWSCNDPVLKKENEVLALKVDSLQAILDSIELLPYLDNMDFSVEVGEPYEANLLAVNKRGISLKALKINGKNVELSDSVVSYSNMGPFLRILPDSIGKYNVRAEVTVRSWGKRVIPLKWPVTVVEKID